MRRKISGGQYGKVLLRKKGSAERRQKVEKNRRQKTEDRRQKTEDRRRETVGARPALPDIFSKIF